MLPPLLALPPPPPPTPPLPPPPPRRDSEPPSPPPPCCCSSDTLASGSQREMSGFAAVSAAQSEVAFSLVPETEKTSSGSASPAKVRCSAAMASPIGSKPLLLFLSEPKRAEALPSNPGSGGSGGSGSGANGDEEEEVPFAAAAFAAATPLATELKKRKAPENGLTESGLCTMMR